MSTYNYILNEQQYYVICKGNEILKTPAGNSIITLYESLAKRIIHDLEQFGMNYRSVTSILSWHFTTIDNFAPMGEERVKQVMEESFLNQVDWTCQERYGTNWFILFGKWKERRRYIEQWLSKATLMQLTAACCIGNAYESLNLALVLALVMERYKGNAREEKLREVAQHLANTYQFGPCEEIFSVFKTFELYYGFHLEENGNILDDIVLDIDDCAGSNNEDEIDVDDLSAYSVTVEQLLGRNYYHYTGCEPDDSQPASFDFSEIELDESEEDDEEDDDEEGFREIEDYLPEDCWVKRFVDDEEPNRYYLMYIALNEDGEIVESGCIEEEVQQIGGAGMVFMIPGMEMPSIKSYEDTSYPPEKVIDDLRLLFKGRAMPLDFTFLGKSLPQTMIDEGGNGGSDTEYTYALQSAFRLAYMHMSIETTEEGIIQDFSYSSYQSCGDAYGDMFSRPMGITDRKDEVMDMLLHIYDMYTDEELEKIKRR